MLKTINSVARAFSFLAVCANCAHAADSPNRHSLSIPPLTCENFDFGAKLKIELAALFIENDLGICKSAHFISNFAALSDTSTKNSLLLKEQANIACQTLATAAAESAANPDELKMTFELSMPLAQKPSELFGRDLTYYLASLVELRSLCNGLNTESQIFRNDTARADLQLIMRFLPATPASYGLPILGAIRFAEIPERDRKPSAQIKPPANKPAVNVVWPDEQSIERMPLIN